MSDNLLGPVDPVVLRPDGVWVHVTELSCQDRSWTDLAPEHTWQFLSPHRCILCGAKQPKEN